jgi:putative membrane protein
MKNVSTAIVSTAITAVVPSWAVAQQAFDPDRYGYGPQMMWGGGWYGLVFGPLFMIFVLALVIALAVLLVRWLGGPWQGTTSGPAPQGRAPLDILKERFARGEIDKDEYEERRRVLGE